METKLMVKPRKKQLKRKLEIPNDSDDGHALRTGIVLDIYVFFIYLATWKWPMV